MMRAIPVQLPPIMIVRLAIIFAMLTTLAHGAATAQSRVISGYVEDESNGTRVSGVHVSPVGQRYGAVTNQFGFFSMHISSAQVQLSTSHIAYEPEEITLSAIGDTTIVIRLWPRVLALDEVQVMADRDSEITPVQMSAHRLEIAEVESIPVILGETDIIKTIQLLPGVQGGREGSSGLHVRGGSAGQNLVLLDGLQVYNPTHLLGLFGVFNPFAVKQFELIKGGFPARYGGRLSSVLDVTTREGDMTRWGGAVKLGLLTSQLRIEGPIVRERAAFVVSGRRTFMDWITRWAQTRGKVYGGHFYDLNFKASYKVSSSDQLYVNSYLGRDIFSYKERVAKDPALDGDLDAIMHWGNRLASVRWNRLISDRVFASLLVGVTRYGVGTGYDSRQESKERYVHDWKARVLDYTTRLELEYAFLPNHYLRFGAEHIAHRVHPFTRRTQFTEQDQTTHDAHIVDAPLLQLHEFALYAEDAIQWVNGLRANIGLRIAGTFSDGTLRPFLEPRLSVSYPIRPESDLKMSISRMSQSMHLLPSTGAQIPNGLWVPAMEEIPIERGLQLALGGVRRFPSTGLEFSLESYYRTMRSLVDYKSNRFAYQAAAKGWPDILESGKGRSFGAEAMLRRENRRLGGWISYTLARANRRFVHLNDGAAYPDLYDRRHDFSIAAHYRFTPHTTVGVVWVYGTGYPVWAPIGQYRDPFGEFDEDHFLDYGPVNASRAPVMHRLDLSAQFSKRVRWGHRTFTLGIYNTYNRKNPMYIYADLQYEEIKWKQLSLLQLIPAVSYELVF